MNYYLIIKIKIKKKIHKLVFYFYNVIELLKF